MLNVLPTMSINLPGKLMVSSASNKKLKDLPEMLVYLQRIVMVWPEILSVLYLGGIGGLTWDIVLPVILMVLPVIVVVLL